MARRSLKSLYQAGVSVWLDSLSRAMLKDGTLEKMIDEDGLRGQTSNPSIFQAAVSKGSHYDEGIKEGVRRGESVEQLCWRLMVEDVQQACDMFRPLYDSSKGEDGFVSLELDPTKAHDTKGSLAQARELWPLVDRPNLMLKVPGTTEGLPVVEELVAEGMNVNVTLLFSVKRYEEVMEAFMKGLEKRVAAGQSIERQASVASFFVSRVDTEADRRLDGVDGHEQTVAGLRGKVAVANARIAYQAFQARFRSDRWKTLENKGARLQRPLWASTSTKNPDYRDTLYVDDLIGPHCVNTMPESTLEAFEDHGTVAQTLTDKTMAEAARVLADLERVGVDLDDITLNTLVVEGVEKFAEAYRELLEAVGRSMQELEKVAP